LVATAISFACFGLGGLVLAVFLLLLALFTRDKQRRAKRARYCIQLTFRFFVGLMVGLGAIAVRWHGAEKLSGQRGGLVLANHPSLIDYVLLASKLPDCNCIVKEALWRNVFMGGVIRAAGYIPNNQGATMLEGCRQSMLAGDNLLIFPEGTRSQEGVAMKLQRGAGNIAARTEVEVLFCHITVTPRTLAKTDPWYYIAKTKPVFNVTIGDKLAVETLFEADVPKSRVARELTRIFSDRLQPKQ
jgi:1-acyl-sn-glycerol-3-phosphate acyltransferase